jgi:hypothetical protein
MLFMMNDDGLRHMVISNRKLNHNFPVWAPTDEHIKKNRSLDPFLMHGGRGGRQRRGGSTT